MHTAMGWKEWQVEAKLATLLTAGRSEHPTVTLEHAFTLAPLGPDCPLRTPSLRPVGCLSCLACLKMTLRSSLVV